MQAAQQVFFHKSHDPAGRDISICVFYIALIGMQGCDPSPTVVMECDTVKPVGPL